MTVSAAATASPKALKRGSICRSVSVFMIALAFACEAAAATSIRYRIQPVNAKRDSYFGQMLRCDLPASTSPSHPTRSRAPKMRANAVTRGYHSRHVTSSALSLERVTNEKATVNGKLSRGSDLRRCHDHAVGERAV
jgi:hypothetical protein